ncbi:tRNA pseudouridine(13) synthase TruD [Candidatus Woesearchaeota archaeon]|nr:tRNA pseudouridine(13) synthase TruD [Candidatus Woesearchaeota archaeon]
MYKIKQVPEDFIVEEITRFGNGIQVKEDKEDCKYIYCILKKRDYTTLKALQIISHELGLSLNNIGFAGNKDRVAVTQQAISIYDPGNRAKPKIDKFNSDNSAKGIELKFVGYGNCPISLGELEGNKFRIVVRNLGNKELVKLKKLDAMQLNDTKQLKFVNFYGEQRFSKSNKDIGKLLLQKRFKDAVELIIKTEGESENKVTSYLTNYSNDYVNALKQIPRKLLLMYVHSYQSYIWNLAAEKVLRKIKGDKKKSIEQNKEKDTEGHGKDNSEMHVIEIPVVGFGTDIDRIENTIIRKIVSDIMKKECMTERDFIIRQLPEVSAEGKYRQLFCEVRDFKIIAITDGLTKEDKSAKKDGLAEEDELHKGKKKRFLEFTLPKSSYATEVVRQMFE